MAFTYILRCADDTLYVGHTENLPSREQTHNDGKGAKYTAARRPVRMVYAEEHCSAASAIARERQLKRWSHKKKEALILVDRAALS
jgi:putative endonuclease